MLSERPGLPQRTEIFLGPLIFPLSTDSQGTPPLPPLPPELYPAPCRGGSRKPGSPSSAERLPPSPSHQVDPKLPPWLIRLCRAEPATLCQLAQRLTLLLYAGQTPPVIRTPTRVFPSSGPSHVLFLLHQCFPAHTLIFHRADNIQAPSHPS